MMVLPEKELTHLFHELRIPMTAITEGVSIVLDGIDGPLNQEQKKTLHIVMQNIDRLTELMNTFSKQYR